MDHSVQNASSTGRPLEFDPEKTRDVMMQLFWEKGFAGVSLPDLEKRTGLSRSSLYNSFGSKQEIFEQSLDRYRSAVVTQMCRPLESGEKGLADLVSFFDLVGKSFTSQAETAGCLMVNSMMEFGGADDMVVRQREGHLQRLRSAITATLKRAIALGEISRAKVDAKVDLVVSLLLGISVAARAGLSDAQIASMVSAAQAQIRDWAV